MERTGQQNRVRYSLSIKKKKIKIILKILCILAYLAEDLINSDAFHKKSSDGMVNSDYLIFLFSEVISDYQVLLPVAVYFPEFSNLKHNP